MDGKAIHHAFAVVDIEGFGGRSDSDQRWLRQQMYAMVRAALAEAGAVLGPDHLEDRGDCVIAVIPADVPKAKLTTAFVDRLDYELTSYRYRSTDQVRLRMRLALHCGDVSRDADGWVGRDLNTACRLADLAEGKKALVDAPSINLVVLVSDQWFSSVVAQDRVLAERFDFRPIPFRAKEIDTLAWLHERGAAAGAAGPAPAPAPVAAAPPRQSPVDSAPVFQFNDRVRMRDAINTQTNHGRRDDSR